MAANCQRQGAAEKKPPQKLQFPRNDWTSYYESLFNPCVKAADCRF